MVLQGCLTAKGVLCTPEAGDVCFYAAKRSKKALGRIKLGASRANGLDSFAFFTSLYFCIEV